MTGRVPPLQDPNWHTNTWSCCPHHFNQSIAWIADSQFCQQLQLLMYKVSLYFLQNLPRDWGRASLDSMRQKRDHIPESIRAQVLLVQPQELRIGEIFRDTLSLPLILVPVFSTDFLEGIDFS